jgi:hypothetical protein
MSATSLIRGAVPANSACSLAIRIAGVSACAKPAARSICAMKDRARCRFGGRAKVTEPSMRFAGDPVCQRLGEARLADARFGGNQNHSSVPPFAWA